MKKFPMLINTKYRSSNGSVISANIMDFGAKADGINDDTVALKAAISSIEKTGGSIYLPEGIYKLTENIILPSAMQLIGDFNPPTEEEPMVKGTVLAIYTKTVADGGDEHFFKLLKGSAMRGFSIWYPEQKFTNGVPDEYPYTFGLIDMVVTHLEDINFVNAYNCIDHYSITNNQQICRNIYGTPLRTSVRVAKVNDSSRYEYFNLQPKWWLESGLPNVPDEDVLRKWLIENATGFEMVQTDWHFLADFTIKGYHIGLELTNAFGRTYNMHITECNTCVSVIRPIWYGAVITKGVFKASGGENPVALRISDEAVWGLTCYGCEFESVGDAVVELNSGHLVLQNCRLTSSGNGKSCFYNKNGRFSLIHSNLSGGVNHIVSDKGTSISDNRVQIGWDGRKYGLAEMSHETSKVVNCTFDRPLKIVANVPYLIEVIDSSDNIIDTFDDEKQYKQAYIQYRHPARNSLYLAEDFGVTTESEDISAELQKAIDTAYFEGGGTVYIPKGIYKLEKPITVKSGVELRGVSDGFHYITCDTTYILSNYGSGEENGTPLITMEETSGARGFAVVYDRENPENITPRATTIQCRGKDIYIINVIVSTGWVGLDLNTHRCDNHYIEGYNFYCLKTGIAVGGGSENGVLHGCHANPCTISENPHRKHNWDNSWGGKLFDWFQYNVTGFYFGDTKNQVDFFSIIFGTLNGVHCDSGSNVYLIGHASDYSSNGVLLSGNANAVIIDAQLSGSANRSHAICTDSSFTGTAKFYNPCSWAIRDCSMRIAGDGTVKVFGGVFFENGSSVIYSDGGDITIAGIISIMRFRCDFFALKGTKSICLYGNIPIYKNQYIEESVKFTGSDTI